MYTIIVVDDEEELRHAIIKRVEWERIGFEVVGEAGNGIDALELVEQLEPDLLLTDIRMPFMSGIVHILSDSYKNRNYCHTLLLLICYNLFSYK